MVNRLFTKSSKNKLVLLFVFVLSSLLAFYLLRWGVILYGVEIQDPLKKATRLDFVESDGFHSNIQRTVIIVEGKDSQIVECYIVILNPEDKKTVIYTIPIYLHIEDHSGKLDRSVAVQNLIYAGSTFGSSLEGYEYAVWQLQYLTGLTFNGYIFLSTDYYTRLGEFYEFEEVELSTSDSGGSVFGGNLVGEMKQISLLHSIIDPSIVAEMSDGGVYSNMDAISLLLYVKELKALMEYDVDYIDLSQEKFIIEKDEGILGSICYVNTDAMDKALMDFVAVLQDRNLLEEQAKIEVYNGSAFSGVARRYSRLLGNSGVNVIRFGNANKVVETSEIFVADRKRFKYTTQTILDLFVMEPKIVLERPDFMTTGDIVITLGNDVSGELRW